MPIYRGDTPPNVEGTYLVKPMTTVYCQDYVYEPGRIVNSEIVKFANQNNNARTVEYSERNLYYTSSSENYTSYISGTGDNFTIYLEAVGNTSGISTKTAGIYSGTISASGAINFQYAFVMLDKGYDPDGTLMDIGVFRVFRDGDALSIRTTWDYEPTDIGYNDIDITNNSILGTLEPVWQEGSSIYTEHPEQSGMWNNEFLNSYLLQFNQDGTGSGFMSEDTFNWTLSGDKLLIRFGELYGYDVVVRQLTDIGMKVEVSWKGDDDQLGPYEYSNLITYRKVGNNPNLKSFSKNRSQSLMKVSKDNLLKNRIPKGSGGIYDTKNASRSISVRK